MEYVCDALELTTMVGVKDSVVSKHEKKRRWGILIAD